jgi:hypothetical protein
VNGPRELPVYLPSPSGHLSAVLALPAAGEGPPDVGVVLLSGSHIPRSNKNGMWTRAARDLAALGTATLRMEEDGAGESEGVPDRWPISRISPGIPAAGVRFLVEEVGVSRVLIAATCYGARLAIAGAAEEPAVEGVLFAAAPVMGLGGHRWPVRQARRVMRKVGLLPAGGSTSCTGTGIRSSGRSGNCSDDWRRRSARTGSTSRSRSSRATSCTPSRARTRRNA